MTPHYGHLARVLTTCAEQAMNAALASVGLTAAQGKILGFIALRKQPPCPRDVEEEFQLSHPTVSGLLSRLEKKGFIQFRPDEYDRRSKRIYLLPKGKELMDKMHRTILATEEQLVQGFSPEEQAQFQDYLTRAIDNMGGNPCKRKHKEDSTQ